MGIHHYHRLAVLVLIVTQLWSRDNNAYHTVEAFTASTTTTTTRTALVGLSFFSPSIRRQPHRHGGSPTSSTTSTVTSSSSSSSSSSVTTSMHNTALAMFTGIVEEIGTVVSCETRNDMTLWDGTVGRGTELTVQADVVLDGAYLGCSICVSGVCLTATEISGNTFKAGLAPETLAKTYFKNLQSGMKVNLERASEIGGRNSGHFVQGHVDYTGTIIEKRPDGDSLWFTVRVDDPDLIRYIVPKGFIAVDGTSLTVVDVNPSAATFSFMLVEYTQKKIIQPYKQVGEKVNLEVDVLGKYSETALAALVPRIESLEAKIESLERKLADLSDGSTTGRGGGGGGRGTTKGSMESGPTPVNSFGTNPLNTAKVSPMRPGSPNGPLNTDTYQAREDARRGTRIQTQNQILGYEPRREPLSSNSQNRIARQVIGSKLSSHDEYISPASTRGEMFAAGSSPPPPTKSQRQVWQQPQRSQQSETNGRNSNKPGISGEPPIFQNSRNYKFASVPTENNDSTNQQMRPDPFL